ncbi:MAG: tRNA 2-thiouridine(34) synthase MnmA [Patescibacteria group bacterium]|nr:tRNA 2-thiouridine(34) synthase MnmA [Patescibacteria group bacterium]MDE2116332.1 tRNA 2-thiouridine(34) synthase MnmA [Patescibacteria group bacterium]
MASQMAVCARKKVFVGMSGGVDSSVSAALFKERGFDVTGVFIKVWQPDWLESAGGCSWREDRLDAMRVAVHLGISFVTLDLEREYKKEVVDHMIVEYRAGRTPNPDVMCNRHVKFGAFFDWAMEQGADYVATGHYAQVRESDDGHGRRVFDLVAGADPSKDQSYFLWTLGQKELSRTLFPVGGMEKSETRRLARRFGLPVAEKKDSQGLCFMGKIDIKEFISHYVTPRRGDVLDQSGNVIGHHDGALFLTVGERHGFTVTTKTPDDAPYYVIARDLDKNTVTVSHRAPDGSLSVERRDYMLESVNWIRGKEAVLVAGRTYRARIRHLGDLLQCTIARDKDNAPRPDRLRAERLTITFEKPIIVAPGQSIVVYDANTCLGGGAVV